MERLKNTISISIPFLICLALILITLLVPDSVENESSVPFAVFLFALGVILWMKRKKQSSRDIFTLLFIVLGVWEICTAKTAESLNYLLPTPEMVIHTYLSDYRLIGKGIVTTAVFLACGFLVGVILAILLGILVGWNIKAKSILLPIVKVLTPIPPLIYTPYLIVLMPNFFMTSVAIIFLSVFWGMFLNMIFVVSAMDDKLVDMVAVLNVKPHTMYFDILIPYCLPHVMNRLTTAITAAFMVLFNAEMIGNALSGVGWYIQFNAKFAEYTKVVSGIILAAVLVVLINAFIKKMTKVIIVWR